MLTASAQDPSGIEPTQLAYRTTIEQQYRKQIESMLTPLVGSDGVRVAVSADIDFGKTETSSVTYGQGHLLSQQSKATTSTGNTNLPVGVPGALSNQPPGGVTAPFTVGSASAPLTPQQFAQITPSLKTLAPTSASSSATNNFDLDKTVSQTQAAVGTVKRVSVAVLVDDQPGTGKSPKPHAMSAQQLAQIRQLVQNAIGFDAKRGDQVSVVNMPFSAHGAGEQAALPWWRSPLVWDAVRQAAPYVVALLLGLFLYRSVRRIIGASVTPPAVDGAGLAAGDEGLDGPASSTGEAGNVAGAAAGGELGGELAPDVVRLSNSFENDAAAARELVKQDPRRAAQVVKEWLADG